VSQRQHYVSRFHLAHFVDLAVAAGYEPFLWVGVVRTNVVRRRSPHNIGWERGLYPDGPGSNALALETHLAQEVERDAARALAARASNDLGLTDLPSPIGRYLAWAAARSAPMRDLYVRWIRSSSDGEVVEAPPEGFNDITMSTRGLRFDNYATGESLIVDDVDYGTELINSGWTWDVSAEDFEEIVRLQAWYLQVRFFPRLKWHVLRPPNGGSFVIADRPVVWGFANDVTVPPSMLRHHGVQLFAPLTRSLALFAHHADAPTPDRILPSDVNRAMATAATDWIAGASEAVVREAIQLRHA
jgi:hypothetical protein